jgi:hypothetical protein
VPKLTRRSLLQQTPISAAALSLLSAVPALAAFPRSPAAPQLSATSTGSMVVRVHNGATGEMTLLVGAREIVLRDTRLAASLIGATREAGSHS